MVKISEGTFTVGGESLYTKTWLVRTHYPIHTYTYLSAYLPTYVSILGTYVFRLQDIDIG